MHAKFILAALSAAFVAAQDTSAPTDILDAITEGAGDQFESLTEIIGPDVATSVSESLSSVSEDISASEPTVTDMTDMTSPAATDPAATTDMADETDDSGSTTAPTTSDPSGATGGAGATGGTTSEEAGAAMTAAPVLAAGVLAMLAAM